MTPTHYNDQDLIDALFDLLEPGETGDIRSHLVICDACRERSEGLQAKLAQLDLLREELTVPDALVAEVLRIASQTPGGGGTPTPHPTVTPRFRLWRPLQAAAIVAVLVSVSALWYHGMRPDQKDRTTVAMGGKPTEAAPADVDRVHEPRHDPGRRAQWPGRPRLFVRRPRRSEELGRDLLRHHPIG